MTYIFSIYNFLRNTKISLNFLSKINGKDVYFTFFKFQYVN